MTPEPESDRPPLPDLAVLQQATEKLVAAAQAEPLLASADPSEVIRQVPGKRVILRGQIGVRPAYFRVTLNDGQACAREWQELRRVWPYMNSGDFRVCEPLVHVPEHGVLVVSDIKGTPLYKHLYTLPAAARAPWIPTSARWLRAYTAPTETWRASEAQRWLKRAEQNAQAQAFKRLKSIEKDILTELHRLSAHMHALEWRVAICHGDFHANNLIVGDRILTGVDCGGSAMMPIYKDMARFLMHLGRRAMIPSGQRSFGVDARGLADFADVFELTQPEQELTLPFFLGIEALLRAETRDLSKSRIRRAKEMSEALLADLRTTGT